MTYLNDFVSQLQIKQMFILDIYLFFFFFTILLNCLLDMFIKINHFSKVSQIPKHLGLPAQFQKIEGSKKKERKENFICVCICVCIFIWVPIYITPWTQTGPFANSHLISIPAWTNPKKHFFVEFLKIKANFLKKKNTYVTYIHLIQIQKHT